MSLTQAEIDQMIKDQIGTDPSEPLPSNPDIGTALQDTAVHAAASATMMNTSLAVIFGVAWNNFTANVTAGRVPSDMDHAPKPPKGYIAGKASDGWVYVLRGPDPVVPMPPLPPAPPPLPPPAVFMPAVGQAINQPAGMNLAVGSSFTTTYQGVAMTFAVEVDNTPFGSVTVWRRTA